MTDEIKHDIDGDSFDDLFSRVFGDDIDGEGGYVTPPAPKGRKAAEYVAGQFIDGVGSQLKDSNVQRRIIESALPSGYVAGFDVLNQTGSAAREVYREASEQLKPVMTNLRKIADKALPKVKGHLPEGLTKKLEGFIAKGSTDNEYRPPSEHQSNTEEVNSATSAIFDQYMEDQRAERDKLQHHQDTVLDTIKDLSNKKIANNQLEALSTISNNTSRLADYQDQVAIKFQRKSLDLQYWNLIVNRKTLDTVQKTMKLQETSYGKIIQNTALPEYVKIKNSEILERNLMEKFIGIATEPMSQSMSAIGGKFLTRAKGKLSEFAQSMGTRTMTAADIIGSGGDVSAEDRMRMGGQGLGAAAGNYGLPLAARGLKRLFGNNERVNTMSDTINNVMENGSRYYQDFIKSGETGNGVLDAFKEFMDVSRDRWDENLKVQSSSVNDVDAAAIFTQQTKRTIVEIIPGWLGRIHNELRMTRTGEEGEPDRFSLDSGKFESKKDALARNERKFFGKQKTSWVRDEVESLVDDIDTEGKLSPEARKALMKYLLETSYKQDKMVSIQGLMGEDSGVDAEHRDEVAEMLRARTGISAQESGENKKDWLSRIKLDMKQNPELQAMSKRMNAGMQSVRNQSEGSGVHEAIKRRNAGDLDLLEEMGIVERIGDAYYFKTDQFVDRTLNAEVDPNSPRNFVGPRQRFGVQYDDDGNIIEEEDLPKNTLGDRLARAAKERLKRGTDRLKNTRVGRSASDLGTRIGDAASDLGTRANDSTQGLRDRVSDITGDLSERVRSNINSRRLNRGNDSTPPIVDAPPADVTPPPVVNPAPRPNPASPTSTNANVTRYLGTTGGKNLLNLYVTHEGSADELKAIIDNRLSKMSGATLSVATETVKFLATAKGLAMIKSAKVAYKLSDEYKAKKAEHANFKIKLKADILKIYTDNTANPDEISRLVGELTSNLTGDDKRYANALVVGFDKRFRLRAPVVTPPPVVIPTVDTSTTEPIVDVAPTPDIPSSTPSMSPRQAQIDRMRSQSERSRTSVTDALNTRTGPMPMPAPSEVQVVRPAVPINDSPAPKPSDKSAYDRIIEAIESVVEVSQSAGEDNVDMLEQVMTAIAASSGAGGGGGGDDTKKKRFKLIRKGGKLIKTGATKLINYHKWVYGKVGQVAKFGAGLGIGAVKKLWGGVTGTANFFGREMTDLKTKSGFMKNRKKAIDIYIAGEAKPVITAKDMKAGKYIDSNSKKIILTLRDITGEVVDIEGNIILSKEDFDKGLYTKQGMSVTKLLGKLTFGALGKFASYAGGVYKGMWAIAKTPMKVLKWGYSKTFGRPIDVYVTGETSPRLLAKLILQGRYLLKSNGKPIRSIKDIVGEVVTLDGETVITSEDIHKGLVDKNGNEIKTPFQKLLSVAMLPGKLALGAVKLTGKYLKASYNAMYKGAKGLASFVTGSGAKKEKPKVQTKRITDSVDRIYELLKDRLKPSTGPKGFKAFGDSDGDGDRDGSREDILSQLAAKPTDGNDDDAATPKEEKKSSGFMGILMSLVGVVGGIYKKFTSFGGKAISFGIKALKWLRMAALAKAAGGAMDGLDGGGGGERGRRGRRGRGGRAAGRAAGSGSGRVAGMLSNLGTKGKLAAGALALAGGGMAMNAYGDEGEAGDEESSDKPTNPTEVKDSTAAQTPEAKAAAAKAGESEPKKEGWGQKALNVASYIPGVGLLTDTAQGKSRGMVDYAFDALAIKGAAGMVSKRLGGQALGAVAKRAGLAVGRQVLMRGAMMGASALAGLVSAPVLIGAAVVAGVAIGGYLLYKHFQKGKNPLMAFRMAQYGFKIKNETHAKAIVSLEELCLKNIQMTGGVATLKSGMKLEPLLKLFSVDPKDDKQISKFSTWFQSRFKPVFLGAVTVYFRQTNKLNLHDADKSLGRMKASAMLSETNITGGADSPYLIAASPFGNEDSVPLSAKDVVEQFATSKKEVEKLPVEATNAKDKAMDGEGGGGWLKNTKDAIKNGLISAGEGIKKGLKNAKDFAGNVLGGAGAALSAGFTAVKSAHGYIKDTITDTAGSIGGFIADKAGGLVDGAKYAFAGKGKQADGENAIIQAALEAGINDPNELAMLLAQTAHETGNFSTIEENLKYSAKRLMQIFPKYFKSYEAASAAASGGPQAIANIVYAGRMGNSASGDGYKYRGRGYMQLTGKSNYQAFSKKYGIDVVNNPDLVSQDPAIAAKTAVHYWLSRKGLRQAGASGNVTGATKLVNGGTNGLADRMEKFRAYQNKMKSGKLIKQEGGKTTQVLTTEGKSLDPTANQESREAMASTPGKAWTGSTGGASASTAAGGTASTGLSGNQAVLVDGKDSGLRMSLSNELAGFVKSLDPALISIGRTKGTNISRGKEGNVARMNKDFMNMFYAMAGEYFNKTGKRITITSAYRDAANQKRLYNEYLARGKRAPVVAKPGRSNHERGIALDCDRNDLYKVEALGILKKYHFHKPLEFYKPSPEPWHLESMLMKQSYDVKVEVGKAIASTDKPKVEATAKTAPATASGTAAAAAPASKAATDKAVAKTQAAVTPATKATAKAVAARKPYFVGDSIAHGYRVAAKADGMTQVGAIPKTILGWVGIMGRSIAKYKDYHIYISTGMSNNFSDMASIDNQLGALRKYGFAVSVFGVSNTYPKADAKQLNAALKSICDKYQHKFLGGFAAGSDNIHPASYAKLDGVVIDAKKAAEASAPIEAAQVTAAEPAVTSAPTTSQASSAPVSSTQDAEAATPMEAIATTSDNAVSRNTDQIATATRSSEQTADIQRNDGMSDLMTSQLETQRNMLESLKSIERHLARRAAQSSKPTEQPQTNYSAGNTQQPARTLNDPLDINIY